jgi:UDP-glucose 4-epimerase
MSLKNKSVLVTGGAGFIGSHLVDHLILQNPEIIVVVDDLFMGHMRNLKNAQESFSYLKVYKQDACNSQEMNNIVTENCIDIVFDLATIPLPVSLEKPRWSYEKNVERCLTLCELIRKGCFKTLVHFSSSEAYGSLKYEPMNEEHPWNPKTPYAASKAAEDHLVFSYYHTFGIDMTIIRPFNNYGPRQNFERYAGVIPLTIKRIFQGESPIIYGEGLQTRDYLFVTDTAQASIDIYNCTAARGKVINIASGKEKSIKEIITAIATYLDYNGEILYKEKRIGDVQRHFADISLAKKLIGFEPTVSWEKGLQITIEWYKDLFATIGCF